MKFKKYSATQLFSQIEKITESSFKNEKRICEFPFNLNFSINKNYNQKKEFSGPGIYILTFKHGGFFKTAEEQDQLPNDDNVRRAAPGKESRSAN